MSTSLVVEPHLPGFNFDNCRRNYEFVKKGLKLPTAIKTGTTIAGIIYKDGVVLGADTRATEGPIVADKNCEKIHRLQDNLYCCGAGTAADTDKTTQLISSQLEMHRLNTNRIVPVVAASQLLKQMLYRYRGHIGAYLLLGGVDDNGPHIYSIYAHGSTDKLPYSTLGSGSLAAMSVFESGWKENLEEKDAIDLVKRAILAGVLNDLGSGSTVDICVIRKDDKKARITRDIISDEEKRKNGLLRVTKKGDYSFRPGATRVLSTDYIEITEEVHNISSSTDAEMRED